MAREAEKLISLDSMTEAREQDCDHKQRGSEDEADPREAAAVLLPQSAPAACDSIAETDVRSKKLKGKRDK